MGKYVKLKEAAAAAGVTTGTLRNRIKAGELAAIREGKLLLIDTEELTRYLAARPVAYNTDTAKAREKMDSE